MAENSLVLHTVVSAPFAENAYIAHLDGATECVVVDPGMDHVAILRTIEDSNLSPQAILNTHGHADHIAGNEALKQAFPSCPLIIGQDDAFKLTDPSANLSAGYGMPMVSPPADQLVREGEPCNWAGIDLEVLETPGHSPGHVVFVYKGQKPWVVFNGDVLFEGSIGRTDFPDGSFEDLRRSIHEKLFIMPDDTLVLTGHGGTTTIGQEKQFNPFVGAAAGYEFQ